MSVPPPGGNGRTSRTGLLGQASGACAGAGHGASAIPAAKGSAQSACRSFPPAAMAAGLRRSPCASALRPRRRGGPPRKAAPPGRFFGGGNPPPRGGGPKRTGEETAGTPSPTFLGMRLLLGKKKRDPVYKI